MAKYKKEIVDAIVEWVRENGLIDYGGATLKSFCAHFCIDDETYYHWMKKSEFSALIKKAKNDFRESLEKDIVNSLAKAAKGYDYDEVSTEGREVNENGQKKFKAVKQTRKTKHVEPNVGAGIFLLTNIAPQRWQNKQRQELSGEVDTGIKIVVQDEEEADIIKRIMEK